MILLFDLIDIFYFFFIGGINPSIKTESGISHAIRDPSKLSMTKNIFGDNRIETTLTAEKSSFKRNTANVWKEYGHFKQQPCDFSIDKENLPENTIIYLNQGYQSYKDNKKVYYGDYFSLGQINECMNPPEDLENYEFGPRETKLYRPAKIPLLVNSKVSMIL